MFRRRAPRRRVGRDAETARAGGGEGRVGIVTRAEPRGRARGARRRFLRKGVYVRGRYPVSSGDAFLARLIVVSTEVRAGAGAPPGVGSRHRERRAAGCRAPGSPHGPKRSPRAERPFGCSRYRSGDRGGRSSARGAAPLLRRTLPAGTRTFGSVVVHTIVVRRSTTCGSGDGDRGKAAADAFGCGVEIQSRQGACVRLSMDADSRQGVAARRCRFVTRCSS